MKRMNPHNLEKTLFFLGTLMVALLMTTSLACGQEHMEPTRGSIKVEQGANLQALAQITPAQAREAALARFPGSSVEGTKLDTEDGFLVYEVELKHNGEEVEVLVDAGDGSILRVEDEDSEGDDNGEGEDEEDEGDEDDDGDEENGEEDEDEGGENVELPGAVESAFGAAYPNAEITGSDMEEKDGVTYYEIESRDGAVKRDLLYLPDGTLYEIEEMVTIDALPAAVRSAAEKHGSVLKAERITRGTTTKFEVLVQVGSEKQELLLAEDGRIIEMSQDDEE